MQEFRLLKDVNVAIITTSRAIRTWRMGNKKFMEVTLTKDNKKE